MECAEIRSGFVAGRVPAGPAVEAHLRDCAACRELFEQDARLGRQLALGVPPEVSPGDLFALVERDVRQEVGLRATLRAWPSAWRAAVLVSVALTLLVWQLLFHRRPDFAAYSAVVFWLVVALLGSAIVIGARRVVRGASTPLGLTASQRALPLLLLVTPALFLLLVPLGAPSSQTAGGWGSPEACFGYGAALVAPLLVLSWLFERRDSIPPSALVSAGALAGISANLLLHAHCPSVHLGHLLLGHASIGVAWVLALVVVSRSLQGAR